MYSIKVTEKTLKLDNFELNKKELHASKQPTALNLVDMNRIVISDKFGHSNKVFWYFVIDDGIVRPLCIDCL